MMDRTCAACGKPLIQKPTESRWNWDKRRTCGHGTPCPTAMRNAQPEYSAKMREAKLRSFEADPAKRERVAKQAAKNIMVNREASDFSALQTAFAATLTPEQRSAHYARRRNMTGLSPEEEASYRKLCRKGCSADEARAMVLEESRLSVARAAREMREKHQRDILSRY